MAEMFVAKDNDLSVWLYRDKPAYQADCEEFTSQNDEILQLTPAQSAEFANIKPGECIPVALTWWRGIDSAPKDGTQVLAWDGKAIHIAFWGKTHPADRPAWMGGHCRINHIDQPFMWMPLPPAPPANPGFERLEPGEVDGGIP